MQQLVNFINAYSFVPTVLVALYALFVYRKLPAELKTFSRFIFLSGVTEIVSRVYWFQGKNNLPFLHVYVAFGYVLLLLFYGQVLKNIISRNVILVAIFVFLVLTVANSIFVQPLNTYNSYALTVEAIVVVVLSLSTYIFMMNNIPDKNLKTLTTSLNWINSGLFVYYASGLLIFYNGSLITLLSRSELVKYTWVLHSCFSMIMYCCFFAGLWRSPRN